jgi:hypothetical protein
MDQFSFFSDTASAGSDRAGGITRCLAFLGQMPSVDHSETGIRKSVVVVFILASECDDLISFKVLG